MADEMAARMNDAGAMQEGEVPGSTGGAVPPAGAINTDTAQGGPPESIPYARFKEVNDRLANLRGYEELAQYGYDADSLRRLASFEQQYQADPIGVWRSIGTNLDLPPEVMEAVNRYADNPSVTPPAEGNGQVEMPEPAVTADDRRRLDYVDRMMARDEESDREAQLDRVLAAWDDMDRQAGVQTTKRTQLTWIAAIAGNRNLDGSPVYRTVEDLASAARTARMEERDIDLGNAVRPGNVNGGTPPALPGSSPALSAGPVKFGSLREASLAAEADIIAGRLSPLQE
jgi:hypothetical protein